MKPRKAIERIREIAKLKYDGYGLDIHPAEQLEMICRVLKKVDPKKVDKTQQ
jgi:hypothetical protein